MVISACNGVDWDFEKKLREDSIRSSLGLQKVLAINDSIGAMRAGTEISGKNSAVLCIGTGSNVAVHSAKGDQIVYGYYLRDGLQGGVAIGKRVFELAFATDSGYYPHSEITNLLLGSTGFASIRELMMAVTTGRNANESPIPVNYKHYAWIMLEAYHRGDALAVEYLNEFCREIVGFIILGAKQLHAEENLQVVFSGGILQLCPQLGDYCKTLLKQSFPDVNCMLTYYKPVVGSVLMWYDMIYNHSIPDEVREKFEKECSEHSLIAPYQSKVAI